VKERLTTLGLALGALVLFYVLFLPKPRPAGGAPALPLSSEAGPGGYLAAWRWLKAERIAVIELHDRYDRLRAGRVARSATGNLLLTTLPHELPVRPLEAADLDAWVERGNTLVVMAALDDTPLWAVGDAKLIERAGRLTRLKFEVIEDEKAPAAAPAAAPAGPTASAPVAPPATGGARHSVQSILHGLLQGQESVIEPLGMHPLLQGVHKVRVVSALPASRWRASPMDRSAVLQIGRMAGTGDAAIWLRRQGKGRVITFAVASIFSNQLIGSEDNARLLSNLIGWSVSKGGAVIFDDVHQGAVGYYDAKAFFADPRLHRSLAWIVFLWFMFVIGMQPMRAALRHWNPIDVTAFIAMSGEFFASTLTPAAAGTRLLENFFNAIRRRLGLSEDGRPVWDWLSAQAGVSLRDLAHLRRLHDRLRAGHRVDLVRLQSLLSQMQGILV
jgi:hypothetical protein